MSVFKDDMGLSDALRKIQTNSFQVRPVRESADTEVESSKEQKDFEEIVLSENAQKRQKYDPQELEDIQTGKNLLEATKQGLSGINTELNKTKTQLEKVLSKESINEEDLKNINATVKESLQNIKNIADTTSFNGVKTLDGNSSNNSKTIEEEDGIINISANFNDAKPAALGLTEPHLNSGEDAQEFLGKIQDASKEVVERQKKISDTEEKLIKKVDSLIEFESKIEEISKDSDPKNQDFGEKLKDTAINGIMQNPKTAEIIQIEPLDENMILALLSLSVK